MFKNIEHWKILGFGFTFALAVTGFVLGLLAYLKEDKNDGSDAPVTTKKSVSGVHVDTVNRSGTKTYSVKLPTDDHVKLNTTPSGVKVHAVHVPSNTPMYVDKVQNLSKTGFEVVIYPLDDGGVDTGFSGTGTLHTFQFAGHRPIFIDTSFAYYPYNSYANFDKSSGLAKVASNSIFSTTASVKALCLDLGSGIPLYIGFSNSSADLEAARPTDYRMSSVTTKIIDTTISTPKCLDAAMINGKPAVVYIDAAFIQYSQCTTTNGTGDWSSPVVIQGDIALATEIKLFTLTIGGTKVPACIYTNLASATAIGMNYAQDANGAAWNTAGTIVSSGMDTGTGLDAVDLGNGSCVIVYKGTSGRIVAHKSSAFTALTGVTLGTSHFPSGNAVAVGISGNSSDTYGGSGEDQFSCHLYRDAVHVFMLNTTKAQVEVSYSNGVTATSYTSKVAVGNECHAHVVCKTAMDDQGDIWIASERAVNGALGGNVYLTKYETPEAAGIDEIAIHYSTH